MLLTNSPIDYFIYNDRQFFVKRDDLLHPEFSGNKARKLAYYMNSQKLSDINTVVSFGGNQSNMMYSISSLAKLKQWRFIYYTQTISQQARLSSISNLALSLANGMELVEIKTNFNEFCHKLQQSRHKDQLLICQGGAQSESEYGLKQLANEIILWAQQNQINQLSIIIASGTGTTAWFLQQHLPQFKVYAINCVGRPNYLHQQFKALDYDNNGIYPQILENTRFRFATPNIELFKTITEINKASQIEFDLIYDPVGWHILLENLENINDYILYLHCGGLSGNQSMLQRYRYELPTT